VQTSFNRYCEVVRPLRRASVLGARALDVAVVDANLIVGGSAELVEVISFD